MPAPSLPHPAAAAVRRPASRYEGSDVKRRTPSPPHTPSTVPFPALGINCFNIEHKMDELLAYLSECQPDLLRLQEVWVPFPVTAPAGLLYRAVLGLSFLGGGLVVLVHLSHRGGHKIHSWVSEHATGVCVQQGTDAAIAMANLHRPPHSTTHTHPPRGAPRPAARPPHPVARPRPPHTPQRTQAQAPPAPECSPPELFPPADTNPHDLAHCRTRAQPSPEREGRSPAPPSPAAADQIGPPGRQVTTGPPQPPAPNLQPGDMPSILPAVAAAEAAARKPARITAQPASTTSRLQLPTQARGKRTHTPAQHTPPHNPRPCPPPLAAQPETHTRPPSRAPPGPATWASPTRPNTSTRPPHTHPPATLVHPCRPRPHVRSVSRKLTERLVMASRFPSVLCHRHQLPALGTHLAQLVNLVFDSAHLRRQDPIGRVFD